MPNFPRRAGGTVPPVRDCALDELLATGQLPQDAAPELLPVAEVLAALQAGPSGRELAGKARVLAEFRGTVARSHRPHWGRRPALAALRTLVGSKLAAAAATAAVLVGTAAAAYVGALPAPLQRVAHDAIAAPAAGPSHAGAARDGSWMPAASRSVALGPLCAAYRHAMADGSAAAQATALRKLRKAAAGSGNVGSLCASGPHPAASGGRTGAAIERHGVMRPGHYAGQRPGHHPGKRSVHSHGWWPRRPPWERFGPSAGRAARHHDPSHREAVCGSPPGARPASHFHPSALPGQRRGC